MCQSVSDSEGPFSLIFDKTTTNQQQKQRDLLVHFWDENGITKNLGLFYFGRATVADHTSMLTDVMDTDEYDTSSERLFYELSDGPNIRLYGEI